MKKRRSGFTLVELMIAVAIVGILAAIGIPSYRDYMIRMQVAEGMTLSSGAKVAVAEYYDYNKLSPDTGHFPDNNKDAGLVSPVSIQGKYVSKVDVGTALGQIRVTYGNDAHALIQDDVLILSAIPHGDSLEWTCYSDNIDHKYLADMCHR
jgi:type IV pilus assembly protein PilA